MRYPLALGALLALAIAGPAAARASVRIGVNVNIPGPVVEYREEPRWVMEPRERVCVVDDDQLGYDYFRYGGWYWVYENDYWYRARRYNGPFVVVRANYVPAPIWRMGYNDHYRWRHRPANLPPGLARRAAREHWDHGWEGRDDGGRGEEHGNMRGNGRGQGRGHGHGNH